MYYTHWTRLLCTGVIPFLFLSTMNLLINKGSKNSPVDKIRKKASFKNKQNFVKTLIAIVILYMVCNIPRWRFFKSKKNIYIQKILFDF